MAAQDKDEDLDLDVEKKSGGGLNTKMLIIILAVFGVVVIGAAVGIALLVSGSHGDKSAQAAKTEQAAPAAGESENAPPGKAVYVNIDPPFVVNFEDQTLVRYLQIGVSLMSHTEGAKEGIEAQMPLIKSKLLLLFSAQKYDEIKTPEGKQKLQDDALKVVRDVLKEQTGKPYVDQVLFTSFVMQ